MIMAIVRVPTDNVVIREPEAIRTFLSRHAIEHEQWMPSQPVAADAPVDDLLRAYGREVGAMKQRGGYAAADVIDVGPETPNLDVMLARFNREHWHDEDEVRFIVDGRGLFHVHPSNGPVFAIEVEVGDLIRVPRGTRHWFDLCADRRIRAIRLFQGLSGWTPHYTDSAIEKGFQPVCFGPIYIAPNRATYA
jgi:1,2-dihydroxy-3-keto-5-methylthiopentene dioxygenase